MKLSPSQFTKFEDSKGSWIWYITWIDKRERDLFFTVWTVIHSLIEWYNKHGVRHLEDIDKLIQEDLEKNGISWLSDEEMDKIRSQVSFWIENYMFSNPERHEQPEQYFESEIAWHVIRWYVDSIWVDYKTVSWFCDPAEETRNGITTYRKYEIGAMIYAVLLHNNRIKIDKYKYIEILKADTAIKENTTYKVEQLVEIIQSQGVTDDLSKLTKKELVNQYAPRKQGVRVVEFDITDEFLAEGREYIKTKSAEMVKTIENVNKLLYSKLM